MLNGVLAAMAGRQRGSVGAHPDVQLPPGAGDRPQGGGHEARHRGHTAGKDGMRATWDDIMTP